METKYIFVTGGVVSSLGKGIISASIGKLLQARGYKVTIKKFDPYINIDPGTLNPYEHGECYVTEDGFETDLDLGHYERFTGIRTTRNNSITTGRIYKTVIDRERRGDYLGKTIQVVPHITDEIKRRMLAPAANTDEAPSGAVGGAFVICEIGGTIGDIESAPFMEAIRQLRWELGRDAVCVHLTYVPYLKAADELKTKPTQHSVKELQSMGIQPDILVLRTERHLDDAMRMKVASFCNVDLECVVQSEDMPSIYEVPVNMQQQGLDAAILKKTAKAPHSAPEGATIDHTPDSKTIEAPSGAVGGASGMASWHDFLDKQRHATREVHIALVGKYDLQDAYKSIRESLNLAGIYNDVKAKIHFINSEGVTAENVAAQLQGMAGIVICPGFGQRGIEGKIIAAEYTRTHDIPTFGICLGMQMMVIEFARNVLGYQDANSSEMSADTKYPVIDLMEEQKTVTNLGGTMRLGAYDCELVKGSHVFEAYGKAGLIRERHRHRYEFNNEYKKEYEQAGMKCVGINPAANLVEIVEIPDKRWYIGTQFHPEYSSTVLHPHPLFMSFIKACI
jgi:CTP synthase